MFFAAGLVQLYQCEVSVLLEFVFDGVLLWFHQIGAEQFMDIRVLHARDERKGGENCSSDVT